MEPHALASYEAKHEHMLYFRRKVLGVPSLVLHERDKMTLINLEVISWIFRIRQTGRILPQL